jgi:competence ComEA-like helix-hairpin-helix protein
MFNLTSQERRVLLFLMSATLVGMGINFLAKKYSCVKMLVNLYQDIGKVNLNTADKDLLISIPGIGEKLAKRILEYREKQTIFNTLEELKNIKGINDYRYEKIKDYLTIK